MCESMYVCVACACVFTDVGMSADAIAARTRAILVPSAPGAPTDHEGEETAGSTDGQSCHLLVMLGVAGGQPAWAWSLV